MERTFADLSSYQERFNAAQYSRAGHRLVMLKATEGVDWIDPTHADRAAAAHGYGLDVWHYHFAHPDTDPSSVGEAAHFWQVVRPHYQPGDRLVLDIELHHPDGPGGLVTYTTELDRHVINISGVHPAAYTYDALLRETGARWQVVSGDWLIANYGGRVRRLGAGRRMVSQQYTDGQVGGKPQRFAGIGQCDGNRLAWWYSRKLAAERRRRHKAA